MGLSLAFDIARSSLSTNAERASVTTRNIEAANDPSASRKSAELLRTNGGGLGASVLAAAQWQRRADPGDQSWARTPFAIGIARRLAHPDPCCPAAGG